MVVVNDGTQYPASAYPSKVKEVIQHSRNKCVGISKNEALRYLIQDGCEHLFLIEDDMIIKRNDVFDTYIKAAEASGIYHLSFALHGPANKKQIQQSSMDVTKRHLLDQNSEPNPRTIIDYGNGTEIALYPNCVGSVCYYLRGVIKHIGYIDEQFKNSWDHVEHTYRIIKEGLHPAFWWFADINKSWEYIGEAEDSIKNSAIARSPDWIKNFNEGAHWFKHKHGYFPTSIPDTQLNNVLETLKTIKTNYSKSTNNK
jgi:GT2 family glycosyltransferase